MHRYVNKKFCGGGLLLFFERIIKWREEGKIGLGEEEF